MVAVSLLLLLNLLFSRVCFRCVVYLLLRPETIAEVCKTCSESDSGSFSESDDFDADDVMEGSSEEGLKGKRMT